jgi:transposase
MRGDDPQNESMFSYVRPEQRIPPDHPLRAMRTMVDEALKTLSRRFDRLYAATGRPSIPPEQLLRALLLQMLYSVRSERLLIEQLHYNLLFRWFVGLRMDDPVWDATSFTKNRERLLRGDVAAAFFGAVLRQADTQRLLSDEHFTVDGTILEAWASHKSFRPKDEDPHHPDDPSNPSIDFRGERRSNATHQSTTDPEARLYKKGGGRAAHLSYLGHVLMENRHGLIVGATVTAATGTAECEAALTLTRGRTGTLGGDKGYDTAAFVAAVRARGLVPHVAQNTAHRRSRIDGRTTRHAGYVISQRKRKLVEQSFGWLKTIALLRKVRHRGTAKVRWIFTFAAAVFNLVRIRALRAAAA